MSGMLQTCPFQDQVDATCWACAEGVLASADVLGRHLAEPAAVMPPVNPSEWALLDL